MSRRQSKRIQGLEEEKKRQESEEFEEFEVDKSSAFEALRKAREKKRLTLSSIGKESSSGEV